MVSYNDTTLQLSFQYTGLKRSITSSGDNNSKVLWFYFDYQNDPQKRLGFKPSNVRSDFFGRNF